ncbi:MAG: hypothetical protein WCI72_00840 [archaeon]
MNNKRINSRWSTQGSSFYGKRGQVTIFIIIAILIVAIILSIVYFGGWFKFSQSSTANPKQYIENCMRNSVMESESILLKENTYPNFNSSNYVLFEREKVPYLCIASEFYKACIPQDPAFFMRIKQIMENKVTRDTKICLTQVYKDLEDENYQVTHKPGEVSVDIVQGSINIKLNETMYISKDNNAYTISGFEYSYGTKFYDMIKLVQTIVNYESTLCEFNKLNWMKSYNDIIISTTRTSDQTKIYTLKDRMTDREIKFAIKTCVLPAGI